MEPMNKEQQIGALVSTVEDLKLAVQRMTTKLDALEERVEEKFKTAEAVFKVSKFVGLTLVAVLTLKFGDISRLWYHFFG